MVKPRFLTPTILVKKVGFYAPTTHLSFNVVVGMISKFISSLIVREGFEAKGSQGISQARDLRESNFYMLARFCNRNNTIDKKILILYAIGSLQFFICCDGKSKVDPADVIRELGVVFMGFNLQFFFYTDYGNHSLKSVL